MASADKRDISRMLFFASIGILFGLGAFYLGLYSGAYRNALFDIVTNVWKDVKLVFTEAPNIIEPVHFLQPSRKAGAGVTVNERADDGGLLFLSGFFEGGNELRLIHRDGKLVARWPVSFSKHFPDPSHLESPPKSDRNIDLHGALIHADGSVVFNYEYGGMVKLDRCGETVWALAHPTHHSIEIAETGGYWVPGRKFRSEEDPEGFPPFTRMGTKSTYKEDLILKVASDGTIRDQKSVPRILYDNGLEPVMTATGYSFYPHAKWERELVHVNKIGELPRAFADAFPAFDVGDLVLSLRQYNLVFVVDPDDWRIKWYQVGPWRRQHDPEFRPDGTINVFNNNVYRIELGPNDRSSLATPRVSNLIKINPTTGQTDVIYGERPGQEFLSVIRGKIDPTTEGGYLITEPDGGRVFEIDAQGQTVWEYINRYDADQVLRMNDARLYSASYFNVEDWGCQSTDAAF